MHENKNQNENKRNRKGSLFLRLAACLAMLLCTIILGAQTAFATNDLCIGEQVFPSKECSLVVIANCSKLDYFILNSTSGILENGTLAELDSNNSLYKLSFNQTSGDYVISWCDGGSMAFMRASGGDDMTYSLSISLFFGLLALGVFLLPKYLGRISSEEWVMTLWRGLCFSLGLFLVLQWLVVTATIAEKSGLGLEGQVLNYVEPIMWLGIGIIMIVVIISCFQAWGMFNESKERSRSGMNNKDRDDYDEYSNGGAS